MLGVVMWAVPITVAFVGAIAIFLNSEIQSADAQIQSHEARITKVEDAVENLQQTSTDNNKMLRAYLMRQGFNVSQVLSQ